MWHAASLSKSMRAWTEPGPHSRLEGQADGSNSGAGVSVARGLPRSAHSFAVPWRPPLALQEAVQLCALGLSTVS